MGKIIELRLHKSIYPNDQYARLAHCKKISMSFPHPTSMEKPNPPLFEVRLGYVAYWQLERALLHPLHFDLAVLRVLAES